jgi:hypothetical protein
VLVLFTAECRLSMNVYGEWKVLGESRPCVCRGVVVEDCLMCVYPRSGEMHNCMQVRSGNA